MYAGPRASVESEVLVGTAPSRLLDAQLHDVGAGLEQMGRNLERERYNTVVHYSHCVTNICILVRIHKYKYITFYMLS